MRRGKVLTKRMTALLLAGLTLCLGAGCVTARAAGARLDAAVEALAPAVPKEPVMEAVRFLDKEGGLWLSYNDYRALERNIIAMREYAAKLKAALEFYENG